MVASIIKTVQIRVLVSVDSDPTVATVDLERWLYIETYLVIITTSIPCLRSLIRIKGRKPRDTYEGTQRSGLARSGNLGISMRSGQQETISGRNRESLKKSCSEEHIVRDTTDIEIGEMSDWKNDHGSVSCEPVTCSFEHTV